MDLGLEGKTALITGASHGLGRAVARALAAEGVRVAICGRHMNTLQIAADEIESATNTRVMPFVADVRDLKDLERFAVATTSEFGGADILVNNADLNPGTDEQFFELADEVWIERFNVKVLAAVRLTRLLSPGMIERGWGRIINLSGGTTRRIGEGGWTKGATQAGLINLTKRLSVLLGPHGITVNAIEPGAMWTDGPTVDGRSRAEVRREAIERAASDAGLSYDDMNNRLLRELVIGRRVEPEDAANVILFLASKHSATITGEVILANGGIDKHIRY